MDAEAILSRLQEAPEQQLPLSAIKTDEAFQPRLECVLPYSIRVSTKERSNDHVAMMRLSLDASLTTNLEPVLAAEIEGVLYIVDGHHRLRAYRAAKRETIPARVCALSREEAVAASKLANCGPHRLPLMRAQRWESTWQWMAIVTCGWREPLGQSYRVIGDRFGVDKNTIMAMVKRGKRIRPEDWDEAERDPGTGFPRWDVVKRAEWKLQDGIEEMNLDKAIELRAAKLAAQIGHLMYGVGTDMRRRVWQMLAEDHKQWLDDQDFLSLAELDEDEAEAEF